MKHSRSLVRSVMLLLALLLVNPAIEAANKKARPPQKERTAKIAAPTQQEEFQKRIEQEIATLKEDVNTRATSKQLEEVKKQADETASRMRIVIFSAAGIGFVLGCAVTFIFARRTGSSDANLKIT